MEPSSHLSVMVAPCRPQSVGNRLPTQPENADRRPCQNRSKSTKWQAYDDYAPPPTRGLGASVYERLRGEVITIALVPSRSPAAWHPLHWSAKRRLKPQSAGGPTLERQRRAYADRRRGSSASAERLLDEDVLARLESLHASRAAIVAGRDDAALNEDSAKTADSRSRNGQTVLMPEWTAVTQVFGHTEPGWSPRTEGRIRTAASSCPSDERHSRRCARGGFPRAARSNTADAKAFGPIRRGVYSAGCPRRLAAAHGL